MGKSTAVPLRLLNITGLYCCIVLIFHTVEVKPREGTIFPSSKCLDSVVGYLLCWGLGGTLLLLLLLLVLLLLQPSGQVQVTEGPRGHPLLLRLQSHGH